MKWNSSNCVVKCNDVYGCLVVFEKSNYDKHKRKHAELRQNSFCPDRIVDALKKPTFVIKGKTSHTLCYYLEEYSKGEIILYTKVVVYEQNRKRKKDPICKIMTAHRAQTVKETNYGYRKIYLGEKK